MKRSFILPSALVLLAGLASCHTGSPEAQVKQALDECLKAIEAGDPAPVADKLSPRFQGPEGMDAGAARLFLVGVLRREKVGVTLFSQKVQVQGSEATQHIEVLLTSRTGASLLPDESSRKAFLLRWENRDGKWMLREVQQLGS